jgi:hypothetical protein
MSATHTTDELRRIAQHADSESERVTARNILVARGEEVEGR